MRSKVLIVEDEPLLRMLTIELVEEAGFEALEAEDADAAMALLEMTPGIDAMITDIDMPGSMNGLRLAAVVRDRWPPVAIIVVSGKQRPAASELPANSLFLQKPFDMGTMTEQLRTMMN
jgi:DNA-binding response OmpR family regulator